MRKVILSVAVSLDGFIEGPNGEYDWCFTDQDYGMAAFFKRIDTVFIGRKSYEMSLGIEGGADWMPPMKEYIFSTTLTKVKEGATIIQGNVQENVLRIKNEPGKDIWLFGGSLLTTSLMNAGLVDECSLAVHPILLGAGKPLFSNMSKRVHLELLHEQKFETGLVMLGYKVLQD